MIAEAKGRQGTSTMSVEHRTIVNSLLYNFAKLVEDEKKEKKRYDDEDEKSYIIPRLDS